MIRASLGTVRENWRIALLVVFVVASGAALLAPTDDDGGDGDDGTAIQAGPTNLQYGLDLSGGTRIRAPLHGMTAEGVDLVDRDVIELRRSIAGNLGVSQSEVRIDPRARTVEVFTADVAEGEFAAALDRNDLAPERIRDGVSQRTREETVRILSDKINRGGLTGGTVTTTRSATGEYFVVVEVPNANRSEVVSIVSQPGRVEIMAQHPVERDGTVTARNVSLFAQDGIASVGTANPPDQRHPQPYVPVTLTDEAANNFSSAMRQFGFTDEGIRGCHSASSPEQRYCLHTVRDGRVVFSADMSPGLAQQMEAGQWADSPAFEMTATNMSEARQLVIDLNAGALPTSLDLDRGTSSFIRPSYAQRFKPLSLLTGLVAWLAVSGVVFVRYGSLRVAVPMLATAMAEVFLLLGFAATVGLALDFSHIAGFIAVIGTGVDDLIIIADGILQRGEIATGRVFQSRFRKAFFVIGVAAATTIIAMSPLTVLSLGDLTGFAIVTIVGVLLGVLVTRPAYGDILRELMLDEE